jgi:hypothetical protein
MFVRYIISMILLVAGISVGVALIITGSVWQGWSIVIAVCVLVVAGGSLNTFFSNY